MQPLRVSMIARALPIAPGWRPESSRPHPRRPCLAVCPARVAAKEPRNPIPQGFAPDREPVRGGDRRFRRRSPGGGAWRLVPGGALPGRFERRVGTDLVQAPRIRTRAGGSARSPEKQVQPLAPRPPARPGGDEGLLESLAQPRVPTAKATAPVSLPSPPPTGISRMERRRSTHGGLSAARTGRSPRPR